MGCSFIFFLRFAAWNACARSEDPNASAGRAEGADAELLLLQVLSDGDRHLLADRCDERLCRGGDAELESMRIAFPVVRGCGAHVRILVRLHDRSVEGGVRRGR
jgi:hypothetical protein